MNTTITKDTLLADCKLFGTGKRDSSNHPGCKECSKKYSEQHKACLSLVAAAKSAKSKKPPARVPGYWGYAQGSFTDIFCQSICERPMTMNQAAAIIDSKTGEPIGPHPKCKKRLIAEKLAVFDGHLIYMRVYPKGHPLAGQLTPAAKLHRETTTKDTAEKAA